jgi:hypothetical protein
MAGRIARTLVVGAMIGFGLGGPEMTRRLPDRPRFEGAQLVRPEGFDEWPLAGASLGMSYSPSGASADAHDETFHRVYVNPSSYRSFLETGTFPEGTTFVLELYDQAGELALPARHGRYEGRRVALEVSVKDRARFREGWAYFDFANGTKRTATAFDAAMCQSCHVKHAASDCVFVQFYPRLRAAHARSVGDR